MDEYGSITIDNKNLLNDLLGLEHGYDNEHSSLIQQRNIQQLHKQQQSKYLPAPVQGRKTLLESPTFSKKEDDIYRWAKTSKNLWKSCIFIFCCHLDMYIVG